MQVDDHLHIEQDDPACEITSNLDHSPQMKFERRLCQWLIAC